MFNFFNQPQGGDTQCEPSCLVSSCLAPTIFHQVLPSALLLSDSQFSKFAKSSENFCSVENMSFLPSVLSFYHAFDWCQPCSPIELNTCIDCFMCKKLFKTLILIKLRLKGSEKLNTNCWEKWLGGLKLNDKNCFTLFLAQTNGASSERSPKNSPILGQGKGD